MRDDKRTKEQFLFAPGDPNEMGRDFMGQALPGAKGFALKGISRTGWSFCLDQGRARQRERPPVFPSALPSSEFAVQTFLFVKSKEERSLLELRGLGKELWKNRDVADYIDQERQTWDHT